MNHLTTKRRNTACWARSPNRLQFPNVDLNDSKRITGTFSVSCGKGLLWNHQIITEQLHFLHVLWILFTPYLWRQLQWHWKNKLDSRNMWWRSPHPPFNFPSALNSSPVFICSGLIKPPSRQILEVSRLLKLKLKNWNCWLCIVLCDHVFHFCTECRCHGRRRRRRQVPPGELCHPHLV